MRPFLQHRVLVGNQIHGVRERAGKATAQLLCHGDELCAHPATEIRAVVVCRVLAP